MRATAIAALVLAAVVLALAGCSPDAPKFMASDVTGTAFGRDFALTDHTGRARTLADFRGKAAVLFFGYTQCPDVCPTTMAQLAQIRKSLGARGDRLETVIVTIDPDTDVVQTVPRARAVGKVGRVSVAVARPGGFSKILLISAFVSSPRGTDFCVFSYCSRLHL